MIMNEASYLEHHGIKGMKWGQRRAALGRGLGDAGKSAGAFVKKHKKGLAVTAGVGAAFVAGRIAGRHGHISLKEARARTNIKSGQLVRDIGHQFVKDKIDKEVVLNFGRQIKEGLVDIHGQTLHSST